VNLLIVKPYSVAAPGAAGVVAVQAAAGPSPAHRTTQIANL
jgi:hypothetical protein